MDEREALTTACEILFHLDVEKDTKEKLLTKIDLSDDAYKNMMAWLIKIQPELDEEGE